MASKKRRGRPKGSMKKKPETNSPQTPEVLAPEKPKTNLLSEVKGLLQSVFPSGQTVEASLENPEVQPIPNGHSSTSGFDAIVEEGLSEYGASSGSDGSTAAGNSPGDTPDSGPSVVPGLEHYVSPEMVRGFLEMLTESLCKVHGDHWHMSEAEKAFIVPVNVAMLDEQLPKLFGYFDNPALVAWAVVMVGWIGIKSPAAQAGIMKLFDKLFFMIGGRKAQA